MSEYVLFHGTPGDNVLSILATGSLQPGRDQRVYFSPFEWADVLSYGADASRGANFVIKVRVVLPDEVEKELTSRPGVANTLIATTSASLRAEVLEMYVRRFSATNQFVFEKVIGPQAIKKFLQAFPLKIRRAP
jgi:hypothetical protein